MTRWNRLTLIALIALTASCAKAQMADAPAESAAPENEEITNNQEQGVDEGGIVKNIGDHLVVLRNGWLYAVDVGESAAMAQDAAIRVAPHEQLDESVWYDEMLVNGRDIYVVGFRYGAQIKEQNWRLFGGWGSRGVTEIDHFVLGDDGTLERQEVVFFESNDYYDTSNYASRMIGDRFVFYIPFYQRNDGKVPHLLEWTGENHFRRVSPLYDEDDVASFGEARGIRHTIVSCDTSGVRITGCSAKAMDGGWWTTRYVTSDDVFLYAEDKVVAFSLLDGSISAHTTRGQPIDQFSFKMIDDTLHIVTRDWSQNQAIELMSLPRAAFDATGEQDVVAVSSFLRQPERNEYLEATRFVDDGWLMLGLSGRRQSARIIAYNVQTGVTRDLEVERASVQRIEPMRGVGALVALNKRSDNGWRSTGLEFLSIALGDDARLADRLHLDDAAQGDHRSHGFFFKPDTELGGGRFGLPVVSYSGARGWWGTSVANIAFFDVSESGKLAIYGTVSASDSDGNTCETSCIDWYGNTRPIFLRDRVYALMGSEIAEVSLDRESPSVVQRLMLRKPKS